MRKIMKNKWQMCIRDRLWGNPLYAWDAHKNSDFSWWISRIRTQLKNLDILRIDHFRGFDACWSVPYGEPTAVNGHWAKVPRCV